MPEDTRATKATRPDLHGSNLGRKSSSPSSQLHYATCPVVLLAAFPSIQSNVPLIRWNVLPIGVEMVTRLCSIRFEKVSGLIYLLP